MPKKREIKRILVSQPKPANPRSPYYQIEEEYGVEIDFKQLFTIEPVSLRDFHDQKVDLDQHTAVVLTSRTMTGHFFDMMRELRYEVPEDMKYFFPNELTSSSLQQYVSVKKRKVYFPNKTNNAGTDLVELIMKNPKEVFLIPIIEGTQQETALNKLDEKKIAYTQVVMSKVMYTPISREEVAQYDLILFFSHNGVESLFQSIPDYQQGTQLLGCLGEKTQQIMEERGLRVDVLSPTPEFTSITAALEHQLSRQ